MNHETTVPPKVPVIDVSDEQLNAIEAFYDEFLTEYSMFPDRAEALVSGSSAGLSVDRASEASVSVSKMKAHSVELYGVEIPFGDPYATSSKHTYYYGIHAGGYRLTIAYHDASGGSYSMLRVTKEEDLDQ